MTSYVSRRTAVIIHGARRARVRSANVPRATTPDRSFSHRRHHPNYSFTDPKGNTTSYSFLPGSATSTTTRPVPWEQLFQVYTPDAPNVPNTEYDYDTLGRIAQIKDAENLQIGDRAPYQFYIADGTRGERDDPLGDAWSVAYDVYGHPATYTDEDGNITTDLADGRGRVVQTTYPEGDQEQFQFDDNNNVLQLTKIP